MKNLTESRLFFFKSISLIAGFLCNLLTTKILVEKFGLESYAIFATVTSVPMLLPFADLGLGLIVFNHFVLEKDIKRRQELFTRIFYFSITFALIIGILLISIKIFISTFLIYENRYLGIIFLIIFLTFASVPFALTYRILQAQKKMVNVVLIQSVIPVIIYLSLFGASLHTDNFSTIFLIIPSGTYLLITLVSFISFRSYKFISPQKFPLFNVHRNELATGWISIGCIISSILILQVPRIILTELGRYTPSANYSLVLLILIPTTSIVSVMTSQAAAQIIEETLSTKRISLFTSALKKLIVAVILIAIGVLMLPLITSYLHMRFIDYEIAISAAVLLLSSIPWQVAFYILTTGVFLRRQFIILSSVVLCDFLILLLISPGNLYEIVYFVLLPTNIYLSIFSTWNLKRFLNKDSSALFSQLKLMRK